MLLRLLIGRVLWWFVKAAQLESLRIDLNSDRYKKVVSGDECLLTFLSNRQSM